MNRKRIPFNKPYLSGKELTYISEAILSGRASGNQRFTKLCHRILEERYGFRKTLLTTSCTDALEMAALLLDLKDGDEVILPSYAFVSTANPFIMRGAKLVFADSSELNPNIDPEIIEDLITDQTKVIVVIHYAGIACDMRRLLELVDRYNLYLVEDAAQAIDSYYNDQALGSFGDCSTFSFHETKNITCGEGGLLVVNNEDFIPRSEIIWEKGTNRAAFFRGQVNKYEWVDVGSSFLPSDLLSAFLYAQLENLEDIQQTRIKRWNNYYHRLEVLEQYGVRRPYIPPFATNNAHLFYLICNSLEERTKLIQYLDTFNIQTVFHYLSLHKSPFFKGMHDGRQLNRSDDYSDALLRLPLYYELSIDDQNYVIDRIVEFYEVNYQSR